MHSQKSGRRQLATYSPLSRSNQCQGFSSRTELLAEHRYPVTGVRACDGEKCAIVAIVDTWPVSLGKDSQDASEVVGTFWDSPLRVRTHDQNFVPLIIFNKIVTLPKINVPSRQINVPPCQMNDPPSQINVPHCQINVPLSNKCSKFLRRNHDPRDIYLQ